MLYSANGHRSAGAAPVRMCATGQEAQHQSEGAAPVSMRRTGQQGQHRSTRASGAAKLIPRGTSFSIYSPSCGRNEPVRPCWAATRDAHCQGPALGGVGSSARAASRTGTGESTRLNEVLSATRRASAVGRTRLAALAGCSSRDLYTSAGRLPRQSTPEWSTGRCVTAAKWTIGRDSASCPRCDVIVRR